jgi:hypothetical protein
MWDRLDLCLIITCFKRNLIISYKLFLTNRNKLFYIWNISNKLLIFIEKKKKKQTLSTNWFYLTQIINPSPSTKPPSAPPTLSVCPHPFTSPLISLCYFNIKVNLFLVSTIRRVITLGFLLCAFFLVDDLVNNGIYEDICQ